MATMVQCKLGADTGHPGYVDAPEAGVALLQPALAQAPTGFAWWLCALNFELARPKGIAIVGEDAQPFKGVGCRGLPIFVRWYTLAREINRWDGQKGPCGSK